MGGRHTELSLFKNRIDSRGTFIVDQATVANIRQRAPLESAARDEWLDLSADAAYFQKLVDRREDISA